MSKMSAHGCMGLRHTYGKDEERNEDIKHEHKGAEGMPKGKPPFMGPKKKDPDMDGDDHRKGGHGMKGKRHGDAGDGDGDDGGEDGGEGMAGKGKKKHGWEGHGMGKPPFKGAAPPIHLQKGGKFKKGKK